MALAVLLAKCFSVHSHMFTILCLLRQRLVQCVVCFLLVIDHSFADHFSIVFNDNKSNCLIFEPTHKASSFINQKPIFTL